MLVMDKLKKEELELLEILEFYSGELTDEQVSIQFWKDNYRCALFDLNAFRDKMHELYGEVFKLKSQLKSTN